MENLGDRAQALAEGRQALRHDHEFLKINWRIAVGTAVDDVGHGHGQYLGVWAADVFVEWLAECIGPSLGGGEGHGEHGIGT